MKWLALIISLPTNNTATRMRIWRATKTSGAAALRDGVYLLPDFTHCYQTFSEIAAEVKLAEGSAYVVHIVSLNNDEFTQLFNRDEDFSALLAEIEKTSQQLGKPNEQADTRKQIRKLRKTLNQIIATDFFPNDSQQHADKDLQQLELAFNRLLAPDEPHANEGAITLLSVNDYQNRIWATRRRPWVDRLACAWLIQRFIDTNAKIMWLDAPADCPQDALGFDFDGARFSHIGSLVTFEVLLASFGLEQTALKRIAGLVHYLDVGGMQPPEAQGVESVLQGLNASIPDDDQLLLAASPVFDALLVTFSNEVKQI